MTKLERRLDELRRLRDAGTITDDEHVAARQRAIDAAAAGPGDGFRFGFKFVFGGIAAVLLAMVVFAACAAVFVRSSGGQSSTTVCTTNGVTAPCASPATMVTPQRLR